MKDPKNLLLILLSIGLLSTWFYHFYDKVKTHNEPQTLVKNSTEDGLKDSLQLLFNIKNQELDSMKINTQSLREKLDSGLIRTNSLRTEIGQLFKNGNITKEDLKKVNTLLGQYLLSVDQLKSGNNSTDSVIQKMNEESATVADEKIQKKKSPPRLIEKNENRAKSVKPLFSVSNLKISAVTKTEAGEQEVTSSKQANKLVFSFTVQSNASKNSSYDLYIVIMQPGKKILQSDIWATDHFTLKNGLSKAFTKKIRFEYNTAEKKKIWYSLEPEQFFQGNYVIQIYQNGVAIGETSMLLN